jgi:hypothetical protein
MVKQAEKVHKRSPLLPVFGLVLAGGLFAIAFAIAEPVMKIPQVRGVVAGMGVQAQLGIAFMIWLVLLALAFFLVAMLSGKDPESAKGVPMPPKQKDLKKKR